MDTYEKSELKTTGRDLINWNGKNEFVLQPGEIQILVGTSSADNHLKTKTTINN